jgi:molybdopterin converting factor subunit 1
MKIKVLFFANLRDLAGARSLELDLPAETTVQDLKTRLAGDHPTLAQALQSALVAVNREYAFDENVLPEEAEVAFFPPVSGG